MSYNFYDELKSKRDSWSSSHPNCIPFTSLPRFSEHLTIQKGTYYLITASSGVGKSRFVKDMFIHNPIKFCEKSGIGLDITLFTLEESIKRFYLLELCRQLYVKHGLSIDIKELQSTGMKRLDPGTLEKVRVIEEEHFPYLNKHIKVTDVRDAEVINRYILNKAKEKGRIITKTISTTDHTIKVFDRYEPYKDEYVIIIIDHVKLLGGKGTIKSKIDKFSSEYLIQARDRYNFIFVVVQQQVASKEAKEFTKQGSLIENMEPSLEGLGEHKLTQQDANVVLGLFHPYRYKQDAHNGYNINKLKNDYRSVRILKNRDGIDNLSVGMHFHGPSGVYTELPKPDSPKIQKFYV